MKVNPKVLIVGYILAITSIIVGIIVNDLPLIGIGVLIYIIYNTLRDGIVTQTIFKLNNNINVILNLVKKDDKVNTTPIKEDIEIPFPDDNPGMSTNEYISKD